MAETPKTLIFVGAAVLLAALAAAFRPVPYEAPRQNIGDRLFDDIEDATAAAALEIVRIDETTSDPTRLKVARQGVSGSLLRTTTIPPTATARKNASATPRSI